MTIKGEITDEALNAAREELLYYINDDIRKVAEKKPDEFFAICKQPPWIPLSKESYTVGCKVILPTVSSGASK